MPSGLSMTSISRGITAEAREALKTIISRSSSVSISLQGYMRYSVKCCLESQSPHSSEMSIPGLGDAVTLFEVSKRLIEFINDLRHAQDDLLGLQAEANTLRICINAVRSPSCRKALYLYIDKEQGRDLGTIVDTCKSNLQELNAFVASCAALVEKQGRKDGPLAREGYLVEEEEVDYRDQKGICQSVGGVQVHHD